MQNTLKLEPDLQDVSNQSYNFAYTRFTLQQNTYLDSEEQTWAALYAVSVLSAASFRSAPVLNSARYRW